MDVAATSLGQALPVPGLADRSGRIRAFRQNNLQTGELGPRRKPRRSAKVGENAILRNGFGLTIDFDYCCQLNYASLQRLLAV